MRSPRPIPRSGSACSTLPTTTCCAGCESAISTCVGALRDPSPVDVVVQKPLFDDPFAVVARRDDSLASKNRCRVSK